MYNIFLAIDDKKVTKNLLQLIRWKNKSGEMKELRLYEVLASVWCDVSDFLNLEGHTRKNIETKHRGDSKQCIRDVIEKWSNDEKPTYDYTWSGICKMLKNLELSGTSLLLKEALTADISSFNKGMSYSYTYLIFSSLDCLKTLTLKMLLFIWEQNQDCLKTYSKKVALY